MIVYDVAEITQDGKLVWIAVRDDEDSAERLAERYNRYAWDTKYTEDECMLREEDD